MKKTKFRILLLTVVLIVLSGFWVYLNSLDGEFIWDEDFLIKDNLYIKDWSNIQKIFTQDIGAGSSIKTNFYRPLQMLTYMVDYSARGLRTRGYHLTNTILHIFVALALYWFIYTLSASWKISFLASILFIVHPIHTEAIAYIPGRADSLAALFILLCVAFYIKNLAFKNSVIYILILLNYMLALLSKEFSLITPILLVIYCKVFKKKLITRELLSILGITFIYIFLRLTILKFDFFEKVPPTTLFQRLPGFFFSISEYFRLLLFPFSLHMEYVFKLFRFAEPKAMLGVFVLFMLLIYAFRKRETNRLMSFSIYWFFVALLPVSNLYSINAYMSEHWLYLPSMGFFLFLADGLTSLYKKINSKVIITIFIMSIVVFYSNLTIQQNSYWKNKLIFNQRTLKYVLNSPKIYNNLCKVYTEMGSYQEAIEACNKSIVLRPNFSEPYYNLANIYKISGKYGNAIAVYKKTIEINPSEKTSYYELGNLYDKTGKNEEAIQAYNKAIEIDRNYFEAYNNLAAIYADSGRTDLAIELWNKVVKLNPNFATARFNLAVFYFKKKQYELAIQYCDSVIKLGYQVDPIFLKELKPYRK